MRHEIDVNEFSPIVREYAGYKQVIQGCSPKTVEEYLLDLRTFFRYLLSADRPEVLNDPEAFCKVTVSSVDLELLGRVTTNQIYEFMLFVDTQRDNLSAAKARKLSAIKSLYKYLVNKRNLLPESPAAHIESPKRKKSLPKHLTLEESLLLLDTVRADKESRYRLRDYTIITLFLNCGMRLSELTGINVADLDRGLRSMRVVGKGNKERVVYLNDACRQALAEYLLYRTSPDFANVHDKALFLSRLNQRLSVKTVQAMVYKYLSRAGLESKHFSVHKLRHTAATLMYQSGEVDIRVLKDILGHEQLNTTQIYTHVSDRHMEEAMQHNPLSGVTAKPAEDTDDKE